MPRVKKRKRLGAITDQATFNITHSSKLKSTLRTREDSTHRIIRGGEKRNRNKFKTSPRGLNTSTLCPTTTSNLSSFDFDEYTISFKADAVNKSLRSSFQSAQKSTENASSKVETKKSRKRKLNQVEEDCISVETIKKEPDSFNYINEALSVVSSDSGGITGRRHDSRRSVKKEPPFLFLNCIDEAQNVEKILPQSSCSKNIPDQRQTLRKQPSRSRSVSNRAQVKEVSSCSESITDEFQKCRENIGEMSSFKSIVTLSNDANSSSSSKHRRSIENVHVRSSNAGYRNCARKSTSKVRGGLNSCVKKTLPTTEKRGIKICYVEDDDVTIIKNVTPTISSNCVNDEILEIEGTLKGIRQKRNRTNIALKTSTSEEVPKQAGTDQVVNTSHSEKSNRFGDILTGEKIESNMGCILYLGLGRPVHPSVDANLKMQYSSDVEIDSSWAKFASSAVQIPNRPPTISRLLVPIVCRQLHDLAIKHFSTSCSDTCTNSKKCTNRKAITKNHRVRCHANKTSKDKSIESETDENKSLYSDASCCFDSGVSFLNDLRRIEKPGKSESHLNPNIIFKKQSSDSKVIKAENENNQDANSNDSSEVRTNSTSSLDFSAVDTKSEPCTDSENSIGTSSDSLSFTSFKNNKTNPSQVPGADIQQHGRLVQWPLVSRKKEVAKRKSVLMKACCQSQGRHLNDSITTEKYFADRSTMSVHSEPSRIPNGVPRKLSASEKPYEFTIKMSKAGLKGTYKSILRRKQVASIISRNSDNNFNTSESAELAVAEEESSQEETTDVETLIGNESTANPEWPFSEERNDDVEHNNKVEIPENVDIEFKNASLIKPMHKRRRGRKIGYVNKKSVAVRLYEAEQKRAIKNSIKLCSRGTHLEAEQKASEEKSSLEETAVVETLTGNVSTANPEYPLSEERKNQVPLLEYTVENNIKAEVPKNVDLDIRKVNIKIANFKKRKWSKLYARKKSPAVRLYEAEQRAAKRAMRLCSSGTEDKETNMICKVKGKNLGNMCESGPSANGANEVQRREVVTNIVKSIVDYVCEKEAFDKMEIDYDPDYDPSPESMITSTKDGHSSKRSSIADFSVQRLIERKDRCARELARLDVNVINLQDGVEDEPSASNEPSKYCMKESCKFGCLCQSLNWKAIRNLEHCSEEKCIFGCVCDNPVLSGSKSFAGAPSILTPSMKKLHSESSRNFAVKEFHETVFVRNENDIKSKIFLHNKKRRDRKLPERFKDHIVDVGGGSIPCRTWIKNSASTEHRKKEPPVDVNGLIPSRTLIKNSASTERQKKKPPVDINGSIPSRTWIKNSASIERQKKEPPFEKFCVDISHCELTKPKFVCQKTLQVVLKKLKNEPRNYYCLMHRTRNCICLPQVKKELPTKSCYQTCEPLKPLYHSNENNPPISLDVQRYQEILENTVPVGSKGGSMRTIYVGTKHVMRNKKRIYLHHLLNREHQRSSSPFFLLCKWHAPHFGEFQVQNFSYKSMTSFIKYCNTLVYIPTLRDLLNASLQSSSNNPVFPSDSIKGLTHLLDGTKSNLESSSKSVIPESLPNSSETSTVAQDLKPSDYEGLSIISNVCSMAEYLKPPEYEGLSIISNVCSIPPEEFEKLGQNQEDLDSMAANEEEVASNVVSSHTESSENLNSTPSVLSRCITEFPKEDADQSLLKPDEIPLEDKYNWSNNLLTVLIPSFSERHQWLVLDLLQCFTVIKLSLKIKGTNVPIKVFRRHTFEKMTEKAHLRQKTIRYVLNKDPNNQENAFSAFAMPGLQFIVFFGPFMRNDSMHLMPMQRTSPTSLSPIALKEIFVKYKLPRAQTVHDFLLVHQEIKSTATQMSTKTREPFIYYYFWEPALEKIITSASPNSHTDCSVIISDKFIAKPPAPPLSETCVPSSQLPKTCETDVKHSLLPLAPSQSKLSNVAIKKRKSRPPKPSSASSKAHAQPDKHEHEIQLAELCKHILRIEDEHGYYKHYSKDKFLNARDRFNSDSMENNNNFSPGSPGSSETLSATGINEEQDLSTRGDVTSSMENNNNFSPGSPGSSETLSATGIDEEQDLSTRGDVNSSKIKDACSEVKKISKELNSPGNECNVTVIPPNKLQVVEEQNRNNAITDSTPPGFVSKYFLCSIAGVGYVDMLVSKTANRLIVNLSYMELMFDNVLQASEWLNNSLGKCLFFCPEILKPEWRIIEKSELPKRCKLFDTQRLSKYTFLTYKGPKVKETNDSSASDTDSEITSSAYDGDFEPNSVSHVPSLPKNNTNLVSQETSTCGTKDRSKCDSTTNHKCSLDEQMGLLCCTSLPPEKTCPILKKCLTSTGDQSKTIIDNLKTIGQSEKIEETEVSMLDSAVQTTGALDSRSSTNDSNIQGASIVVDSEINSFSDGTKPTLEVEHHNSAESSLEVVNNQDETVEPPLLAKSGAENCKNITKSAIVIDVVNNLNCNSYPSANIDSVDNSKEPIVITDSVSSMFDDNFEPFLNTDSVTSVDKHNVEPSANSDSVVSNGNDPFKHVSIDSVVNNKQKPRSKIIVTSMDIPLPRGGRKTDMKISSKLSDFISSVEIEKAKPVETTETSQKLILSCIVKKRDKPNSNIPSAPSNLLSNLKSISPKISMVKDATVNKDSIVLKRLANNHSLSTKFPVISKLGKIQLTYKTDPRIIKTVPMNCLKSHSVTNAERPIIIEDYTGLFKNDPPPLATLRETARGLHEPRFTKVATPDERSAIAHNISSTSNIVGSALSQDILNDLKVQKICVKSPKISSIIPNMTCKLNSSLNENKNIVLENIYSIKPVETNKPEPSKTLDRNLNSSLNVDGNIGLKGLPPTVIHNPAVNNIVDCSAKTLDKEKISRSVAHENPIYKAHQKIKKKPNVYVLNHAMMLHDALTEVKLLSVEQKKLRQPGIQRRKQKSNKNQLKCSENNTERSTQSLEPEKIIKKRKRIRNRSQSKFPKNISEGSAEPEKDINERTKASNKSHSESSENNKDACSCVMCPSSEPEKDIKELTKDSNKSQPECSENNTEESAESPEAEKITKRREKTRNKNQSKCSENIDEGSAEPERDINEQTKGSNESQSECSANNQKENAPSSVPENSINVETKGGSKSQSECSENNTEESAESSEAEKITKRREETRNKIQSKCSENISEGSAEPEKNINEKTKGSIESQSKCSENNKEESTESSEAEKITRRQSRRNKSQSRCLENIDEGSAESEKDINEQTKGSNKSQSKCSENNKEESTDSSEAEKITRRQSRRNKSQSKYSENISEGSAEPENDINKQTNGSNESQSKCSENNKEESAESSEAEKITKRQSRRNKSQSKYLEDISEGSAEPEKDINERTNGSNESQSKCSENDEGGSAESSVPEKCIKKRKRRSINELDVMFKPAQDLLKVITEKDSFCFRKGSRFSFNKVLKLAQTEIENLKVSSEMLQIDHEVIAERNQALRSKVASLASGSGKGRKIKKGPIQDPVTRTFLSEMESVVERLSRRTRNRNEKLLKHALKINAPVEDDRGSDESDRTENFIVYYKADPDLN